MSTINFYLQKETKKGEAVAMLLYQKRGHKFKYSTRLKVDPKHWKDQRVKSQCTDAEEINSLLDSYKQAIREIEREAIFQKKELSIDVIKRKLEARFGKLSAENNFFKAYDIFIEKTKTVRTPLTIKAYVGTKNKLLEFQSKKKEEITFEAMTTAFYERFLDYLIVEGKYLNNTVGRHIKTLKTFLNYAKDHEFTNAPLNMKKFKVFNEDVDIIYLTDTVLMKIHNLNDLSPTLEEVRDCFCFSCFTGLRFSDISKLTRNNHRGNYIEIRTEKTKELLKIPLNDYAKELISKYQNRLHYKLLPTGLSNQKTNAYLKEIAKKAELKEIIETENYSGSKKIITSNFKYDLVTSHTARRTFVTLALEKGIRSEVVMAMTGHKSYRTFKKYIKITDKVMQNEMFRLWNKPLLKVV